MGWVLAVLALGVLLVALVLRAQGPPGDPGHARQSAEPDRPVPAQEALEADPFFAEVDRFLRVSARERRRKPSAEAVRGQVPRARQHGR
jgi:hypothetical protein